MPALKRLLVATDFSVAASHATERAARLVRNTGASLDLIHITKPALAENLRRLVYERPSATPAEQGLFDGANKELSQLAASIQERHGVASSTHLAAGSLIKELVGHAETLAADLVVLGFCGASLMRHFLLGSTAERLVTKASCPLLVVKRAAAQDYRSVLVPVDFSRVSLATLVHAHAIAGGAKIALLHVFEAPFESKLRYAGVGKEAIRKQRIDTRQQAIRRLRSLCNAAAIPEKEIRLLALHGNPAQRIVAQERIRQCDLIAIGKQGENMLENLFIGSVTRQVMTQSQSDVLICV